MASELPGHRGIQLGRLNAVTNVGQIAGSSLCGFLLAAAGYDATFATLAATGLLAFIAGLATKAGPPKRLQSHRKVLGRYRPLLRRPIILYSMICAYLSALPFSLSMSFYPLLLTEYGYGEETSGVIIALRAIGAIAAGLIAARRAWAGHLVAGRLGGGRPRSAAASINHASDRALMLVIGVGSGAMTLYFRSRFRGQRLRGWQTLALGGLLERCTGAPLIMGLSPTAACTAFYVLACAPCLRRGACHAALGFLRTHSPARPYAALNMPGSRECRSSRR
jgi:hypothetical protein